MSNETISKIQLPNEKTYDLKDEGAKRLQTAITSPTASGEAFSFIDAISQNIQGVISATKKTIPDASTTTKGLFSSADKIKLNNTLSASEIETKIGLATTQSTANAVAKTGYLTLNYTTWEGQLAALRAGLNQQNRYIAMFVCYSGEAAGILTNNNYRGYLKGYVTLSGQDFNLYDFFAGALSTDDMFAWRLTASDSAPTISNFRNYADYETTTAAVSSIAFFSETTWSQVYAKLKAGMNDQNGRGIALFTSYSGAISNILTGGNYNAYLKGYVTMSGADSNLYDFFAGSLSAGDMYAWRITATDSAPTISNFRRFTDLETIKSEFPVSYVNIGAENMLTKIAQISDGNMIYFRTTSTTTGQPGTGMYLIGTAIRTGNNISIRATEMSKSGTMYQNGTTNAGSTWTGWETFVDSEQSAKSVKLVSDSVYTDFDDLWQNGNGIFSIRTNSTNQSAPVPQTDGYWYVFQATIYSDNRFGVQIATRSTNNYNVYMRKRVNGTNYPWIKTTFEAIT